MSVIVPTCGQCRWFTPDEYGWGPNFGHCFLHPPTVVAVSTSMDEPQALSDVSRRPTVKPGDRCAAWAPSADAVMGRSASANGD